MFRNAAVMAVLLVALCACDAQGSSGTSSSDSSLIKNATYSSVSDLIDAAVKAGYACPSRQVTTAGLSGKDYGRCTGDDVFQLAAGTTHGFLALQKEADAYANAVRNDRVHQGETNLFGPNWIIQCPKAQALMLQKRLGGAISTVRGP